MKAVIIDDEYYAMQGLKMELEDIGDIEVFCMYENSSKMLYKIQEIQPDIVFLDIEMPEINGFELFERMLEIGITLNIVFVSAYDQYAIKAFEINAMDYIVKPATKSRILKTLERIKFVSSSEKDTILQIKCFRHFSILMNNKEVSSGWRTRKAEELIAFLVSEKGSFVSKEKIAESLWPAQDRKSALSDLYMAFYYLKKQESKTNVRIPVESERGKMRINTEHILCDMLEFDKLIDAGNKADEDKKAVYLEEAVDLYQGLIFEDCYYNWTDTIQGHYEYKYMESIDWLISYYSQESNEKKVKFFEKKVKID